MGRQVAELAHDQLHVPKLVGVGVARHLLHNNRDAGRVSLCVCVRVRVVWWGDANVVRTRMTSDMVRPERLMMKRASSALWMRSVCANARRSAIKVAF